MKPPDVQQSLALQKALGCSRELWAMMESEKGIKVLEKRAEGKEVNNVDD